MQEASRHVPDDIEKNSQRELIAQARRDPQAFARLYRRHYDGVFRYCVHRLFDRTAAEDVTSTIFLKIVEKFHRFEGDEKAFSHWLYRIATNTINTYLRKSVQRKKLLQGLTERAAVCRNPSGAVLSGRAEKMALLSQAMLTLKPRYQTIITLRFFESLKYGDIAGIIGGSEATARSRTARALAKLRLALKAIEKDHQPEVEA